MCIGSPLQVEASEGRLAWASGDGHRELLDMSLVGPQAAGTWVLAFQGAAREVLTPQAAAQAQAGRRALAAVQRGETDIEAFFADLVHREPQLPAHLLPSDAALVTEGNNGNKGKPAP